MSNCKIDGCECIAISRGLCSKHYQHQRYHGEIARKNERAKCSVEGCEKPSHAKGVCINHYMQLWRKKEVGNGTPNIKPEM